MRPVRLAYLGTPDLAVPPLRALVDAGHEVRLVVTRADRRRGRGPGVDPSPVKRAALELGIPVAHDLEALEHLAAEPGGVELAVVVAYGRIIPAAVLDRVPMVNLHFSLLPRWRGAAPVERAILAGDPVTGVCVMAVEEGLDTGPVYARAAVPVAGDEHLGPLRARLVAEGVPLLLGVLAGGAAGLPRAVPQSGEAVYAAKVDPDELRLTWEQPAEHLARVVRLDRAWTTFRGRRLRVLEAEEVTGPLPPGSGAAGHPGPRPDPGTLLGDVVVAGRGALRLLRVQPQDRRPAPAADWLRGARPEPGERVGEDR